MGGRRRGRGRFGQKSVEAEPYKLLEYSIIYSNKTLKITRATHQSYCTGGGGALACRYLGVRTSLTVGRKRKSGQGPGTADEIQHVIGPHRGAETAAVLWTGCLARRGSTVPSAGDKEEAPGL